ncbi:HalOD1 output domain-containing protein [Halorussus salinus]|uniref:HalOD1 output domain-containing protein n=1 Tax=Halorussus salinus TaxID=1364935 RepID=UPI00138F7A3E|nr:HalOD1 output domain-containing protein [Halorussus salinus]
MDESNVTYTDGDIETRHISGGPPSEAVVLAVADARDRDPIDLPPLNDTLDPDALDALFAETASGRPRTGGRVTFEYAGCTVAVFGSGDVVVKAGD